MKKIIALIVCVVFSFQTIEPMGFTRRERKKITKRQKRRRAQQQAVAAKPTQPKLVVKPARRPGVPPAPLLPEQKEALKRQPEAERVATQTAKQQATAVRATQEMTLEGVTALLSKKILTIKPELDTPRRDTEERQLEFTKLRDEYQAKIDKERADYDKKVTKAETNHEKDVTKIQEKKYSTAKKEKNINKANVKHNKKLAKLASSYEKNVAKINVRLQKATTKLKKKQAKQFYKAWKKSIPKGPARSISRSIIGDIEDRENAMLKFVNKLEDLMDDVEKAKEKYELKIDKKLKKLEAKK